MLDPLDKTAAIESRHGKVEHNYIGAFFSQGLQALNAILSEAYIDPFQREHQQAKAPDGRIVIDYKHFCHDPPPSGSTAMLASRRSNQCKETAPSVTAQFQ